MKTKFKTFIAIVALCLFGFANANATVNRNIQVNFNIAPEAEKSLAIESWMLANDYWNATTESDVASSEKALEIEAWMMADDKFLSQYFKDEQLAIEPWMTDEAIFSSAEPSSKSGCVCQNDHHNSLRIFLHPSGNRDFNQKHEMFHPLQLRMVD